LLLPLLNVPAELIEAHPHRLHVPATASQAKPLPSLRALASRCCHSRGGIFARSITSRLLRNAPSTRRPTRTRTRGGRARNGAQALSVAPSPDRSRAAAGRDEAAAATPPVAAVRSPPQSGAAASLPLGGGHGLAPEWRATAFASFHFRDHFRETGVTK
jgi:hypothetical protein